MTTRNDINAALMRGADTFRDTIDAANYKDYVLSIMFVKYLSDTFDEEVEHLKSKYTDERRLKRQINRLAFKVKWEHSFKYLYENRYDDTLGQLINTALRGIEEDNAQQLSGVFRSIDFNSEANLGNRTQRNSILRELLEDFENLDLRESMIEVKKDEVPADVIGDAYEYMIGEFASRAGKKAGSFFTPTCVSELMARLVPPISGERVYDPTCGSGSLLIRAAKKGDIDKVSIFGQEVGGSAVSMARMNMFIHKVRDAKIAWGDTIANPQHKDDDGNLMTFDVIVANMPFSKDKWAINFNPGGEEDGKGKKWKMEASYDKFHRFDWGVPPASKGDWAFLLHMINSMSANGRVAAVAPHGVLFRGAAEGRIRQKVIENGLLDAVIGLPANMFFGTSIPACILIFKKNKEDDKVLFIDASNEEHFNKEKNQNKFEEDQIQKIVDAYYAREDKDRFAHLASIKEIKENDYNLNIPRYVDTFEEEELIDIKEVQMNIKNIKDELKEVEAKMEQYMKELGLEV
ncbi:MAG: type I restriction-modification system subunit M [Maledivibacter sp.]|jgi:type I restriction enzyme M protein|nr:type I restriction-modification system subunit M [Maledivibacter sp.]